MFISIKIAFITAILFVATTTFAYSIKYTKVKKSNGDKVMRAEIINDIGQVVATGHSGTEGSRKDKKNEALEEAVDDLEEN